MSDHSDTPYPQTDIADFYAFQKPGDPARSILILNVNPDAPKQARTFDTQASYELKVDTDGDAEADIAFHVLFAPGGDGQQTATVFRATGDAARGSGAVGDVVIHSAPASLDGRVQSTQEGPYQFYAGLRSDPFFVDPEGFFNNFQWTGRDANLNANVFGIVLDLPNDALGANPHVGLWTRTITQVNGAPHQMDQVGNVGTAGVFMPDEQDKHAFHGTPPAEQRALFLPKVVAAFQSFGFGEEEAITLAQQYVPDVLRYDYTSAAGYPNGRKLDDDTIDLFVSLVTRGAVTSDLLGPHTDLLSDFPYLGPPH